MTEFLIFLGWALRVLAIFGGLILLTLAVCAWLGPKMKEAREKEENAKKNK